MNKEVKEQHEEKENKHHIRKGGIVREKIPEHER